MRAGQTIPTFNHGVAFLGPTRKAVTFKVLSSGREYQYVNHKAAAEPFADHVKRFFGRSCPAAEIKKLGATDRKGIESDRGKVTEIVQ